MTLVPGDMTSGNLSDYPNGSTLNIGPLRPNCICSCCSLELKLPVVPSDDEFEILLGSVM